MVFLLSIPLLISPAAAWNLQTHQNIAAKVYYSLPSSVQHNLNLNEMKKGSIYPDVSRTDFYTNINPSRDNTAQTWLNKAKSAYKSKNYKLASYYFGIASHYISDTFSAPHCVQKEASALHTAYEKQANNMKPSISYRSGNIETLLHNGFLQGQKDWNSWVATKSKSIPQKDLNNAGSAAYRLIRSCF